MNLLNYFIKLFFLIMVVIPFVLYFQEEKRILKKIKYNKNDFSKIANTLWENDNNKTKNPAKISKKRKKLTKHRSRVIKRKRIK